jgi:hypothetical protein
MDFTDYMLWKLVGICVLAFLWNFFRALIGKSPQQDQSDKQAPPGADR